MQIAAQQPEQPAHGRLQQVGGERSHGDGELRADDALRGRVLTLNVLTHKRLGLPWGAVSDAMMLATGVSLTFVAGCSLR